jgi:NADPH2:quinone reductase
MPHGSHAERVAVGANATWPVPDELDVKEAACVPIAFGTAHDCLFEFGRLTAGESVLIQAGAGGVGLAAIQLAKRMGATVLATASSDDKLERLKEYGLDHGINYKTTNFAEEARRITGGKGVDLVVDSVGTTIEGSIQATGYRGRIIQVGNAGRAEDRRVDLSPLSALNRTFTGVFLGMELAMQPRRAWPMIAGLVEDVAKDDLRVVIDKTFPLAEAAAAHAYLESRQAFGRVVLIPWV